MAWMGRIAIRQNGADRRKSAAGDSEGDSRRVVERFALAAGYRRWPAVSYTMRRGRIGACAAAETKIAAYGSPGHDRKVF